MTDVLTPPPPVSDWRAPVQQPDDKGLTMTDYTRKIHWWVRLFGVVWLTTMIIGAVLGIVAGIIIATHSDDASTSFTPSSSISDSGFSNRAECMAASWTTAAECKALFPAN